MFASLRKPRALFCLLFVLSGLLSWGAAYSISAPKPGAGAPPQPLVLQPLFAKSERYATVKGVVDQSGSTTYDFTVDGVTMHVQELPTGYAWVWCVVTKLEGNPPSGIYRKIVELSDNSRFGSVTYGKDASGEASVYYNFFFLMRTADAESLTDFVDTTKSERGKTLTALRDFLP